MRDGAANAIRWIRIELAGRRWLLLAVVALVLAIGWWVVLASLPHHVLNTYLEYDTKTGIREFPRGVPEGQR
jgi:peptidoglycan/LPS O-acetylase OafA/YrhL